MSPSRMGNIAFFSSILISSVCFDLVTRHFSKVTTMSLNRILIIDVAIIGKYFGIERIAQHLKKWRWTPRKEMEFMYTEGESLKTISSQERTNQSSLNIEDLKMRWDRNKTTLATSRHINLSLPLLPSGPGGVHNYSLREDQGGNVILALDCWLIKPMALENNFQALFQTSNFTKHYKRETKSPTLISGRAFCRPSISPR